MGKNIDFERLIKEKTKDFYGREPVFEEIRKWIKTPDSPQFLVISGSAGTGKTSIAALIVSGKIEGIEASVSYFCRFQQNETLEAVNFNNYVADRLSGSSNYIDGVYLQKLKKKKFFKFYEDLDREKVSLDLGSKKLDENHGEKIIYIVDAIDEAVQPGEKDDLLTRLLKIAALSPDIKIVLTCRPDGPLMSYFKYYRMSHSLIDLESDPFREGMENPYDRFADEYCRKLTALKSMYEEKGKAVVFYGLLEALAAIYDPIEKKALSEILELSEEETDQIVSDFAEYLDAENLQSGRLQLKHKSFYDFLRDREKAGEFYSDGSEFHEKASSFYLDKYRDRWEEADDYGLLHLPRHLMAAGKNELLKELLLNLDWLWSRLERFDVFRLSSAFDLLDDEDVKLVEQIIRDVRPFLIEDKKQLPGQIYGRLSAYRERSQAIAGMLEQIEKWDRFPYLRPLFFTFRRPVSSVSKTLNGHEDCVNGVALTSDDRMLFSTSDDGTVKLWDPEKGVEIKTFTGHSGAVSSVVLPPDEKRIITTSWDRTIKMWEIDSGKVIMTMEGHSEIVNDVAVTPDGKRAVSASWDRTLKVWDLEEGKEIYTLTGHEDAVNSVSISPDGKLALSASLDKTVKMWDLEERKELKTLKGHTSGVTCAVFTADGREIISASFDKTIKIWDSSTGMEIETLTGHKSGVTCLLFTPDGENLVSASVDQTIKVWDLERRTELFQIKRFATVINDFIITSDGKRVMAALTDKTVDVLRLENEKGYEQPDLRPNLMKEIIALDGGNWYFIYSATKNLDVFDQKEQRIIASLEGHKSVILSVAVTPDKKKAISSSEDSVVIIWDLEDYREIKRLKIPGDRAESIAVTPDGKTAYLGSWDSRIFVLDLDKGKIFDSMRGHKMSIRAIAVSPDGRLMLLGDGYGVIRLWDLKRKRVLKTLKGHTDLITRVTFLPDGKRALSASWDKTIRIWDLEDGNEIKILRGHKHWVEDVKTTGDGKRAFSVSQDYTLRVWDLEKGEEITHIDLLLSFYSCAVLKDGKTVACVGIHGYAQSFYLENVE